MPTTETLNALADSITTQSMDLWLQHCGEKTEAALPHLARALPVLASVDGNYQDVRLSQWLANACTDADLLENTVVRCAAGPARKLLLAPVTNALTSSNSEVREAAIEALNHFKNTMSVPTLINTLHNGYEHEQIYAAVALGEIKDASAVSALLEVLHNSISEVRREAVIALGYIKDTTAISDLNVILKDDDPKLRYFAACALGDISDTAAIPALTEALKNDIAPGVRSSASSALGSIGNASAISVLIEALKVDVDFNVRGSAAEALGKIGGTEVIVALSEACNDDVCYVQCCACEALREISDSADLQEWTKTSKEDQMQRYSPTALGEMRDPSAMQILIGALRDAEYDKRYLSIQPLGSIGDTAAALELAEALDDANTDVRIKAAEALGSIGGPIALKMLIKAQEDIFVREAAARALGGAGCAGWRAFKGEEDILIFPLQELAEGCLEGLKK